MSKQRNHEKELFGRCSPEMSIILNDRDYWKGRALRAEKELDGINAQRKQRGQ